MKKALWITSLSSSSEDALFQNAIDAKASIVVIRSSSASLPSVIPRFHEAGIAVYAWRWPATTDHATSVPHYYALAEAAYVARTLIPAGLDGYIVDPESDHPGDANDWNSAQYKPLAATFCDTIRRAARPSFFFGMTSGCKYPIVMPHIPYAIFAAASDALFPQVYWKRRNKHDEIVPVHGGTPKSSYDQAMAAWSLVPGGKPIVAMGGEIDCIDDAGEIAAFGRLVAGCQEVAHFFSDNVRVNKAIHQAIAAL